ncbi:DUF7519 family protein [Natrialba taiwanensis]|uniref:DUF7519 family protein n=1 Tax=Natrialba taiwanensis TaxID=160846 RepID=UPI0006782589|nr:hypothetical protein [Natrialba taiwanensis]
MSGLPNNPQNPSPTRVSASVAFITILGACFAGSVGPIQTAPFLLEATGLTLYSSGILLRQRTNQLTGKALTLLGLIVATSALVGVIAIPLPFSILLTYFSCGLGMLLLTMGVFPVYRKFTQCLTLTGVVFVFIGVAANAIIDSPPLWRSVIAVTMVFLSWDASRRAITLGTQVGNTAETISVEIVGIAASSAVAIAAIMLTIAVSQISVHRSSLVGLALALAATIAFAVALAHFPQLPEPQE